jgi:hypothetical protein
MGLPVDPMPGDENNRKYATTEFNWRDHNPTKWVGLSGPMKVTCDCGWESDPKGKWAMDQYRAHITSLLPEREEIKGATKVKRLEHYGQTKGRKR